MNKYLLKTIKYFDEYYYELLKDEEGNELQIEKALNNTKKFYEDMFKYGVYIFVGVVALGVMYFFYSLFFE